MSEKTRLLIVGMGNAGMAHWSAARDIGVKVAAFSPSGRNARVVAEAGGLAFQGDIGAAVAAFEPSHAVIATPPESLCDVAKSVAHAGVKRLLVEKPGALEPEPLEELDLWARQRQVDIAIAYNRRFYPNVVRVVDEISSRDEHVTEVRFDFSERDFGARPRHAAGVLRRWAVAQSSHLIDLAFFPTGHPDPTRSRFERSGALEWHPAGDRFRGEGWTTSGSRFVYSADWRTGRGWSIEWETASYAYRFHPLERALRRRRGETRWEEVQTTGTQERTKPGFREQLLAFLGTSPATSLSALPEACRLIRLVGEIAGYGPSRDRNFFHDFDHLTDVRGNDLGPRNVIKYP